MYQPKHAIARAIARLSWRARAGVVAGAVLGLGALSAVAVPGAQATTATCTNVAIPPAPPVGCGGVYLPGLGTGTQPDSSSLTLSAAGKFWNSKVVVEPYSPSDSTEDFTVFQVCKTVAGTRTAAMPCGATGAAAIDPLSGRDEFVAMYTPLGKNLDGNAIPANTTGTANPMDAANAIDNLCVSVEKPPGWMHYWVVLRTCSTYGSMFYGGGADTTADNGVPGVVTSMTSAAGANPFQIFSPIPVMGGYVLAEDAISNGFHSHNSLEVLNDTAFGGAGTWQMLYPETDTANAIWAVIGCTNPVTLLTPGFFACPA